MSERLQSGSALQAGRSPSTFLVPGSKAFVDAMAGFQTGFHYRPALIARATHAAQVRDGVLQALRDDPPVGVQATGHGRPRTMERGVLINTTGMDGVVIDPLARTAQIDAGARWEQVIAAAVPHGLVPLSGSAPNVGAIGYTLGGGMGILARQYGYTADHVRWIELVTADGELRRISATDDPELFWAVRGAGANFGVVTRMEVALVPRATLYGGGMYFDAAHIDDVLACFADWTSTAPEDMTASVGLLAYPNLATFAAPLRGRFVAHVRFACSAPAAVGERLVAPFRALGARLIDTVRERSFLDAGGIYDDPPMRHAYYGGNLLINDLDHAILRVAVEVAAPPGRPMCLVDIRHLGGAAGRAPQVANAVGHRSARYIARVLSPVGVADAPAAAARHQPFYDALRPRALGRSLNFIFGYESSVELVGSAFDAADFARLRALKRDRDPRNVFRLNYNIPPA
ncbi:FAD-binding oxidoreductase [Burkholderia singularis]|uniref:FAD-binding oxidoreductase n=1 Tax=Burkholderia singularis TaxID=1503053 RepID=UPI0009E9F62C|nr:FAD-binding oxidoreductase [Burkholderia singularis]